MNNLYFLQSNLNFSDFKFSLLSYVTAFVLTLLFIPPVILMVKRFKLFDRPNERKEHTIPTPTFGGIAIFAGTISSLIFWFQFHSHPSIITFFLSILILLAVRMLVEAEKG